MEEAVMEKRELDTARYEDIHAGAGYSLMTTAKALIPWFRCTVRCRCEEEQPMSELDKFFCMCVDRGIHDEEDIGFVLSLDSEIAAGEADRLVRGGILEYRKEALYFTEFGQESFRHKTRLRSERKEFPLYVNAITGEWAAQKEDCLSDKAAVSSGIRLSPFRTVIRDDVENSDHIRNSLGKLYETNIMRMQLLDYKSVVYCKEDILFYQDDGGKVLFEIYDECKGELDIALSAALRKRYEKRELMELMKAERHLEMTGRALMERVGDTHPKIKQSANTRYVRNREIRELFMKEAGEAKSHLFIISPWITDFSVNETVIKRFECSLERGVRIDIGFGYIPWDKMKRRISEYEKDKAHAWGEGEKKRTGDKEMQTWEVAQRLKMRLGQYSTFRIFYVREGTHEKVFCYDEEHIYVGSCNLLSYDGGEKEGYSGLKFRLEGGLLVEDKMTAADIMKDFQSSLIEL